MIAIWVAIASLGAALIATWIHSLWRYERISEQLSAVKGLRSDHTSLRDDFGRMADRMELLQRQSSGLSRSTHSMERVVAELVQVNIDELERWREKMAKREAKRLANLVCEHGYRGECPRCPTYNQYRA